LIALHWFGADVAVATITRAFHFFVSVSKSNGGRQNRHTSKLIYFCTESIAGRRNSSIHLFQSGFTFAPAAMSASMMGR